GEPVGVSPLRERNGRIVAVLPGRRMGPLVGLSKPSQKRFVPAFGRPESLLFEWPKRSNQEKGHPGLAPSGHPALRVRVRAPRVRRQRILRWANASTSLCSPLRAFLSARPPPDRGPIDRPSWPHSRRRREGRAMDDGAGGCTQVAELSPRGVP